MNWRAIVKGPSGTLELAPDRRLMPLHSPHEHKWRCYNQLAMRRPRLFSQMALCLLLLTQLHAASHKPLDKRIAAILAPDDLARGFWGIEVVSLSTGKVLYARDADKLFTPASNTKLFTTAAALALIGPDSVSTPR